MLRQAGNNMASSKRKQFELDDDSEKLSASVKGGKQKKQLRISDFLKRKAVGDVESYSSEGKDQNSQKGPETSSARSQSQPPFKVLTKSQAPFEACPWPHIWDANVWQEKKQIYSWLGCKDGKLGCEACASVLRLGVDKSQGVSLSPEWVNYTIQCYGENRALQLKSLRKKITLHKKSTSHAKAMTIVSAGSKQILENMVDKLKESELDSTCKIFRTCYHIAQSDRPYSDLPKLVDLQERNGVGMGVCLHSRHSATNIINHIAKEMRNKVCKKIADDNGKISVLIDESTTLGSNSTLIVYMTCLIDLKQEPHVMFLDLVDLPDQRAETILYSLLNCLKHYGFDDAYLQNNLIAFASDGASVMLGKKSGVAKRLKEKYKDIIIWHCLNHRLELAVGDSIDEVQGINHFQIFLDKLYTLYSRSPKNQNELKACCQSLDVVFNKIGRVLGQRWVASSHRTVSAVWENFQALCIHFENASTDKQRKATERSEYSGLLKKLRSPEFLKDLGIMCDVLFELSELSLLLQKQGRTVVYADKLIRRTIRILGALKEKPGTKTLLAQVAAREGHFGSTLLVSNPRHVSFNSKQLITSLINNMTQRLFSMTCSSEKASVSESDDDHAYAELLSQLQVLEPDHWPPEIPDGFGEEQVVKLCRQFKLPVAAHLIKNAFRDYIETGGRAVPADLKPLVHCAHTIPCSTADCERGFSHMNLIVTTIRSKIITANVSSLLFVKLHGPPISMWIPNQYAKTWLRNHRSADDTQTRKAENTDVKKLKTKTEDLIWKYL